MRTALLWAALAAWVGCGDAGLNAPSRPGSNSPPLALVAKQGVDLEHKTIRIGVLNDETGPAAAIGKPYAAGKRLLAAQINAGGSGLLPDGWKIQLVERDHGYNPQRAVRAYLEIKDDVLLIAHCLGSSNTLPLRPMLERDHMIVLPASLSSAMSLHRYTVPAGPTYGVEAMRAMDFVVSEHEHDQAGATLPKVAIVYQQDDYGQDSLNGWRKAAEYYQLPIVSEQKVSTVQRNFETVISELKRAGATHVMLATLPSATARLLTLAVQRWYHPVWLGHSPSWSDSFFDAAHIAPSNLAGYVWLSGLPYWGEAVPGMSRFLEVFARFGQQLGTPDYYLLVSYMQGLLAVEMVKRALEAGVLTRDAVMATLGKIRDFDSAGLGQPLDLHTFPYLTGTRTRVLKPNFAKRTWSTLADWAPPRALATLSASGAKAAAATVIAEPSARR